MCRHQDVWVKEEPQWVHDGYLELIAEDQAPMRMVSLAASCNPPADVTVVSLLATDGED
jgi:hypothetical protein